jgi:glycosyltransferase involved in cell wall biosynthesis
VGSELVTIIITVFNGERFLREAVESCLAQTYANLELIIIDDGSTDSSLAIINSFKDHRIVLLINESNKGQSHSRNRGIKESSGEYIAIMDADDVAYSERIQKQLNYLKSEDADICFSWADLIDTEGCVTGIKKTTLNHNLLRAKLLFECPLIHPTAFWKKSVFVQKNLWYDEQYTYAQDYDLWSRAIRHAKFAVLGETLLKFRFRNEASISFAKVEKQEGFRKLITDREIKILCGEEVDYLSSIIGVRKIYKQFEQMHEVDDEVKQCFRDLTNRKLGEYPYRLKKVIQKVVIQ